EAVRGGSAAPAGPSPGLSGSAGAPVRACHGPGPPRVQEIQTVTSGVAIVGSGPTVAIGSSARIGPFYPAHRRATFWCATHLAEFRGSPVRPAGAGGRGRAPGTGKRRGSGQKKGVGSRKHWLLIPSVATAITSAGL